MTIDVDATKKKIEEMARSGKTPKLGMFGGSLFLFPHPIKELADFMHNYNIHINYDGVHVAGLIAGGRFQDSIERRSGYNDDEFTQNFMGSPRRDYSFV